MPHQDRDQTDKLAIELDDDDDPVADHSTGALLFSGCLLLLGGIFLWQALHNSSPAGVWPRILALLLVALAGVQTLKGLLARRACDPGRTQATPVNMPVLRRRIFTVLWLVAYCGAAQMVGFGPAALAFVPGYMVAMGYRRPVGVVLTTVVFLVVLTLMFDTVANVPVWSARL